MEEVDKKPKFPHRWMFHKTKPAMLIKSEAHLNALDLGWEDSPAKHGVITHPLSEEQELMKDVESESPMKKGKKG